MEYKNKLGLGTWSDAKVGGDITKEVMSAYSVRQREITVNRGVQKTCYVATPQFDKSYLSVCDNAALTQRYGIWDTTEAALINLLRPVTNMDQYRWVQYVDFRKSINGSGVVACDDWCSSPSAPIDNSKLGKCELQWCFNVNAFYSTSIPALLPSDFANVCKRDVIYTKDGRAITNDLDWTRYKGLENMRISMAKSIISADKDTDPTLWQNYGLEAYFTKFGSLAKASDTACDWLKPANVASVDCDKLADLIENHIQCVNDRMRGIVLQGSSQPNQVTIDNFVIVAHPNTIKCIVECNTCVQVCGAPVVVAASNPNEYRAWRMLLSDQMNGGRFGNGYIVTKYGKQIDFLANYDMPEGRIYMLYTGTPNDPDGGPRLLMTDWSSYINYLNGQGGVTRNVNQLIDSMYGGSVISYVDATLCSCTHMRFMWYLYDQTPFASLRVGEVKSPNCTVPPTCTLPVAPDVATPANVCQ